MGRDRESGRKRDGERGREWGETATERKER